MTNTSGVDEGDAPEPHEANGSRLPPEEEPNTTGTLFVMLLFLMALGGLWILMYMLLLER